ncbi:hypothetical protein B0T19DRAFT_245237 [Cercophora scortea]|uniref:Uncharacterized protein n=1 Tax=Cercophora scortea TaxID=314031 RepID=A0AAE0I9Q9_9PEZI|nr:hypothetical protein B0T19DRAFT_245237 [Cercophora scortea]
MKTLPAELLVMIVTQLHDILCPCASDIYFDRLSNQPGHLAQQAALIRNLCSIRLAGSLLHHAATRILFQHVIMSFDVKRGSAFEATLRFCRDKTNCANLARVQALTFNIMTVGSWYRKSDRFKPPGPGYETEARMLDEPIQQRHRSLVQALVDDLPSLYLPGLTAVDLFLDLDKFVWSRHFRYAFRRALEGNVRRAFKICSLPHLTDLRLTCEDRLVTALRTSSGFKRLRRQIKTFHFTHTVYGHKHIWPLVEELPNLEELCLVGESRLSKPRLHPDCKGLRSLTLGGVGLIESLGDLIETLTRAAPGGEAPLARLQIDHFWMWNELVDGLDSFSRIFQAVMRGCPNLTVLGIFSTSYRTRYGAPRHQAYMTNKDNESLMALADLVRSRRPRNPTSSGWTDPVQVHLEFPPEDGSWAPIVTPY